EKDEWLEQEIRKHFPSRTELLRDIEHSTRRIENMQKEKDRLERENRRLGNDLKTAQGKVINYEIDLARYQELVGPLENMPATLMHVLRAAARRFLTSGRSGYEKVTVEELAAKAVENLDK